MSDHAKLFLHLLVIGSSIMNHRVEADYKSILGNLQFNDVLDYIKPQNFMSKNGYFYRKNGSMDEATTPCQRDLNLLREGIRENEEWALRMLDASSKIPSGLIEGNVVDLGMFDECQSVAGIMKDLEVRGRHCMYTISLSLGSNAIPINPTLSICVPTTCVAEDVTRLIGGVTHKFQKTCEPPSVCERIPVIDDIKIEVDTATCSPVDVVVWDTKFIICTIVILIYSTFLVTCTMCEVYNESINASQQRNPLFATLSKFSLKKNGKAILSMESRAGQLPALHGIRFLSMAWVVYGHQHILRLFGVNVNTVKILKWTKSWDSLYIIIAPFAVDTFFTISGFLMSYMFLKQMPKQKRFNVPMYYLHRFIRITPAVIALIVFAVVYVPKIASGPRYDQLMNLLEANCEDKWWPTILYVQNFVEQKDMCLLHLWYLSVDMQLFWISPLILYPLYRQPKLGLGVLTAFFLITLMATASIVGTKESRSTDVPVVSKVLTDTYKMPYTRAGPWLLGIYLGFEVVNYKRRLTKVTTIIGWGVAISCFAFCTFSVRTFLAPGYVYNIYWETFYSTVSRPVWGLGICWLIYACINERAGLISKFLSWRGFLPLSRISYSVYLLHIVFQTMDIGTLRTPQYFSPYYMLLSTISTLFISLVAAFFFSLFFESPIVVLEKILLQKKRKSPSESRKDLRMNEEKHIGAGKV